MNGWNVGMGLHRLRIVLLLFLTAITVNSTFAQVASWEDIGGAPGGDILRRSSTGRLFLVRQTGTTSAFEGSVYYSDDNGVSWRQSPLRGGFIGEFVVGGGRIVVARQFPPENVQLFYQVHLSTDDGETWTNIFASGNFTITLSRLMISPSGSIYGFNQFQVLRKHVVERTWQTIGAPLPLTGPQDFFRTNLVDGSGAILVGSRFSGLHVTTDEGATWLAYETNRDVVALSVRQDGLLLLGANYRSNANSPTGVFRSSGFADTWSGLSLSNNITISSVAEDFAGNVFAATVANGLMRWKAGSTSWETVLSPGGSFAPQVIVANDGSILMLDAQLGIFRSTDNGTSWIRNGLHDKDIFSMTVVDSLQMTVGTLGQGAYFTADGGRSWNASTGADSLSFYAMTRDGSALVAGTDDGIYQSADNGVAWTKISGNQFQSIVYSVQSVSDGALYAGTIYGAYRSVDHGMTWQLAGLSTSSIYFLAADGLGGIYAATGNNGIFRSTDGGTNWQSCGLVRNDIQSLAVTPEGTIIAGVYGGVYHSTNQGQAWILRGLSPSYTYSLLCRDNQTWFAGTYHGVFMTTDGGNLWTPLVQEGFAARFFLALGLDDQGRLLAGTWEDAVHRATITTTPSQEIVSGVDDSGIPVTTELLQNYPNPFNPVTSFTFQVSSFGQVSLKVYDVLGREVATLVDEQMEPGEHSVMWNASRQSSGVYYYRLQTGSFVATKKMLLMK